MKRRTASSLRLLIVLAIGCGSSSPNVVANNASKDLDPLEEELRRRCASSGGMFVARWWTTGRCEFSDLRYPSLGRDLYADARNRCEKIGFVWISSAPVAPECAAPTDHQVKCSSIKGRWYHEHYYYSSERDYLLSGKCSAPSVDAGKQCSSKEDCTGDCVLSFDETDEHLEPPQASRGICAPFKEMRWRDCLGAFGWMAIDGLAYYRLQAGRAQECRDYHSR